MDIRDRALFYYRLLQNDIQKVCHLSVLLSSFFLRKNLLWRFYLRIFFLQMDKMIQSTISNSYFSYSNLSVIRAKTMFPQLGKSVRGPSVSTIAMLTQSTNCTEEEFDSVSKFGKNSWSLEDRIREKVTSFSIDKIFIDVNKNRRKSSNIFHSFYRQKKQCFQKKILDKLRRLISSEHSRMM